jgi:hypothetical protein
MTAAAAKSLAHTAAFARNSPTVGQNRASKCTFDKHIFDTSHTGKMGIDLGMAYTCERERVMEIGTMEGLTVHPQTSTM